MKRQHKALTFFKGLLAILMLFWIVVGCVAVGTFWRVELISKELYGFEPVVAETFTVSESGSKPQLDVRYSYEYAGEKYEGHELSPYNELTVKASLDGALRKWLTRPDELKLMVFVDPKNPSRSSVVRGWARGNRIEGLAYGTFLITLGLGLLYLLFRPSRRVQDLF
ncbi:DUF3592 domain-containing protein [Neolewinella agarilytica]|uniref:DUF3592 domain-containing protein n=1 Tax=Neolewinella agarilytica TaxID=478744 RepID=A0A1H9E374_9BACT|nr:DUF3592 domain-containing protein [Neolewinella agarilytica]SEQ20077.1 Protein of unknown function [Neolewinella agarilytica]